MSLESGPKIINFYKAKDMTSYDVIRTLKRKLPRKSKLGHFGTLDPFACGVLMIGIHGAQRLNEYIHQFLPKTYIASGILGKSTPTGDLTVAADQVDETDYLFQNIANFETEFIQKVLEKKFIGDYLQSPHVYSAAKYEGKALHEWAREGIEIKKEKKLRHVYELNVLEYEFPRLVIEFTVSSGTYIRTLFSECAELLETLGTLQDLERTRIGPCHSENAVKKENWDNQSLPSFKMEEVLDFSSFIMAPKESALYSNGVKLKIERAESEIKGSLDAPFFWIKNKDLNVLGLAEIKEGEIHPKVNFSLSS
mgnify:CR=1 FL=1